MKELFEHGKNKTYSNILMILKAGTVIATRFNRKDNSCYTIFTIKRQ